jgi:ribulose-phosphate 3-epimerase
MVLNASILSSEFKASDLIKRFNDTKVSYIHLDIMDGKFVNNKSFTVSEIKKFNDISKKSFDVHLMVKNPIKYINDLALLNVNTISFHYEAVKNLDEVINLIKNYGIKVGIAINPKTDINVLIPYLNMIDIVLVMSVEPGYSGQAFIESTYNKVEKLKELIINNNSKSLIEVDGGVNIENAPILKEKGTDIIVSASYIQNNLESINELIEL